MDEREYTTLVAALAVVPDPRKARGCRYPWTLLLTLIVAALASGQPHGRAIGQWVQAHTAELRQRLGWPGRRLPSGATLRRALLAIDLTVLEAQIAALTATVAPPARAGITGQALDGKWVRGALAHGERVCLLGLADPVGRVLLQAAVAPGQTELTTARQLLAGRDLTGQVITADAAFTDPALAQQVRDQGGDYLFVVKANHPDLLWAVRTEFREPHYLVDERAQVYDVVQAESAGHGRLERRTLEASTRLGDYLADAGWPDVARVLRRTSRRIVLKTGEVTTAVRYAITSLDPTVTSLDQVAAYWRGHWGIENRVHHVRDVTFREDAGQAHTGHIPQVLAALRNGLLSCLRAAGWTAIADAVRHYAASVAHALALIGAEPVRL